MRARFFLVVGSVGLITTAAALQACSGDTEAPAGPKVVDSGVADVVVVDSAPEAAPVNNDAATCDLSADFSTSIPDASVADGATTSGLCLACAESKCTDAVKACNASCPCQTLAGDAVGCFLTNAGKAQAQLLTICGASFAGVDSDTQTLGLAIVSCLNSKCPNECATAAFKPQDAGADADAQ